MFNEQQPILCGYTKGMVKFAAGKRGRCWLEKVLVYKGFLPSPPFSLEVMGRSCRVLSRRILNQICIFRKVTLTAIGGAWGHSTMQKQRGHIETTCQITMIKFMTNADIKVDTCVGFFMHLTL